MIRLDRLLPVPPDVVWDVVTEPAEMNAWSLAPVRGLDPGDGGGYAAVGALRHVKLPRPFPGITEVIERADAPARLVYRVVGTRAVRYHRGEIRLEVERDGTRLHWDVEMVMPIDALGRATERIIEPKLLTSLDRLGELLASSRSRRSPSAPSRAFIDDADTDRLRVNVNEVIRDLNRLASDLEEQGDGRFWFARVYEYVTEALRDACDRGEVTHVAWVFRLVPGFHALFLKSMEGPPEDHWRDAFEAIASVEAVGGSRAMAFWRALVVGARAHIEGDLPRVLAQVYLDHYAGRCDYVRFRADYLLQASALQEAWKRMAATVPSAYVPPYLRALDRFVPPEFSEFLLAKRYFDPLSARRDAFDRGRELVAGTTERP
jgi:uncharacterized protein YndB with AHSA1/START domain